MPPRFFSDRNKNRTRPDSLPPVGTPPKKKDELSAANQELDALFSPGDKFEYCGIVLTVRKVLLCRRPGNVRYNKLRCHYSTPYKGITEMDFFSDDIEVLRTVTRINQNTTQLPSKPTVAGVSKRPSSSHLTSNNKLRPSS